MTQNIQELVNDYVNWLEDISDLEDVRGWIEITSPYLDHHNDYLQIYAERTDDGFRLTDDGYILRDLAQSGFNIKSKKREDLLRTTLNSFGVRVHDNELTVTTSKSYFAFHKHTLIQAMLSINDLFYSTSSNVASLFYEDVVGWMDLGKIQYLLNLKIVGESGYDHRFDFVIPWSTRRPERIVHSINQPNRDTSEMLAISWVDTKNSRSRRTKAYALLNDRDTNVPEEVLDTLRKCEIVPIPWSDRESALKELAP